MFKVPTDMLKIPTDPVAWPKNCAERAYVNSFGLGGANATVSVATFSYTARVNGNNQSLLKAIIESASSWGLLQTTTEITRYQTKQRRSQLLVFSASTNESLDQIVENCRTHIAEKSVELSNLAYTLGARREHLPVRSFCLADRFDCVSSPSPPERIKEAPSLYFVFTGQGAHWVGMGSELLVDFPSVMEDIRSMDDVLLSLPHPPSWSLLFELFQSDKVIHNCNHRTKPAWDAALTQPLCTALQIAIVNLLRTWGIKPEAVVGHSSGEIAAAYASGSLSQEEAIIVAYYRGLSVAGLSGSGNMLAVGLGREDVMPFLGDGVAIACENSPSSVTLSGKAGHLNQVVEKIRETLHDTFVKLLPVDIAYHSRERLSSSFPFFFPQFFRFSFYLFIYFSFSSISMYR
jgi:acyl transferase domain-containing protein